MIKAIIFDFGNVICSFDNSIFINRITKFTNKSFSELDKLIYHFSDLPKKYETGLISSDEFYKKIVKLCDLKISKSRFIKAYTDIFTPIQAIYDLVKKLKPHYKLALLSDTSEWDYKYGIKPNLGKLFNFFNTISLSFEIKEMKPGKKIFLDALYKLNLKPKQCIYIDDIQKHVESANKVGIHGIHYISYNKLIVSLKNLEVKF